MGEQNAREKRLSVWTIFDTLAKVAAAGAIVWAAVIANEFQSRMTATTVISEREQAESQLRANMFNNLIDPIVGGRGKQGEIPIERERLLVELLALNFHEHFEFKPLLEHVDRRLGQDTDEEKIKENQTSLRSVVRRVTDRQISTLVREGADQIEPIDFIETETASMSTGGKELPDFGPKATPFRQPKEVKSPDGRYSLEIGISEADWGEETFNTWILVNDNVSGESGLPTDFTLTWFDFPLTDNTRLRDGNRFSVVLSAVHPEERSVTLKVIWFPKGFFTARERPINYQKFQEILGLQDDTSR
jgi:hypothetical protein